MRRQVAGLTQQSSGAPQAVSISAQLTINLFKKRKLAKGIK
jgi:hypothetical protein